MRKVKRNIVLFLTFIMMCLFGTVGCSSTKSPYTVTLSVKPTEKLRFEKTMWMSAADGKEDDIEILSYGVKKARIGAGENITIPSEYQGKTVNQVNLMGVGAFGAITELYDSLSAEEKPSKEIYMTAKLNALINITWADIKSVYLHTQIEEAYFCGMDSLRALVIDFGALKTLGIFGCENLDSIYFIGTEKDWKEIEVQTINESDMDNVTVYYFREEEPGEEEAENYWYADDNNRIVVW